MLTDLSIVKEFDKIIREETQDYDLRDFLNDQCRYGQDVFVYYDDTTKLYDEFKEDCEKLLNDLVDEMGMYPWDIFPEWDFVPDSIYNKWYVIIGMFEQYCDYLLEGLDDLDNQENRK